MKIDDKSICNIVNDLLPLYADDACTDESKQLVEEHIKDCPDCAKTLEAMKEPVAITEARNTADELTEFKFLKALKKASRKVKIKIDLVFFLVILLITPFGILTGNQFSGSGRCFTNFDDIKAATDIMDIWKDNGFEATLNELEPMDLYDKLCKYDYSFTKNPYKDYSVMNIRGTDCYIHKDSKDARFDDEEFMSDFWYSVVTRTVWYYIIPADIYEKLEAEYGEDFYKKRNENENLPYDDSVPKKITTQFGDYYYNATEGDGFFTYHYKTPDFREKVDGVYDLGALFYIAERSAVLTPELYDYYCRVYDEVYQWDTAYAEYYRNIGYDGFKTQWKNKISDYILGYEKQGITLADYKYDSAYWIDHETGKGFWDITFEVYFSNGARGYISISMPSDKCSLSTCRAHSTESSKTQYFFLQLDHLIVADYYDTMSFEENWKAYY